jgi:hypothetical protein
MLRKTQAIAAAVLTLVAVPLAAQAPAAAVDVLGAWELSIESPQGPATMNVTFERVEGVLKGKGSSSFGEFQVTKATVTGDALVFALAFAMEGQTFELPFTGKVTADTAAGTFTMPMMGDGMSYPWRAKKTR